MSGQSALSGRNGVVATGSAATTEDGSGSTLGSYIARITNWAVNPTLATSSEWGDSGPSGNASDAGHGYTNRLPGRKDATFTCEGKFDTSTEVWTLFVPEDFLAVALALDTTPRMYQFPRAMCTDFSITIDVDSEEVVGWSASFGTDGKYYAPHEAGPPWSLP